MITMKLAAVVRYLKGEIHCVEDNLWGQKFSMRKVKDLPARPAIQPC